MDWQELIKGRNKKYIIIGMLTVLVMIVLKMVGVLPSETTLETEHDNSSNASLWLVFLILVLLAVLVWTSLKDFTRKSLVKVRCKWNDDKINIWVSNMSRDLRRFEHFELYYVSEGTAEVKEKRYRLTQEVLIPKNKRWCSGIEVKQLIEQNGDTWPLTHIRIVMIDDKSIGYSSNKLKLK